ncbi:lipid-A-disaccharide kinase [Rhizobium sp. RU20A]|uniref:tetraacyldisaccharide 4'-kinase n=1 Tax=Rhizobium sp. RU20A TaxID=1907412 RepID=UPI000954FE51|nr:tetraacyldisaccharide 4'-kinase [Rhizobium sp. RU20A]SIR06976.1 lipid-A-disaccharide kinase [Rhizobium sp. RU20A]
MVSEAPPFWWMKAGWQAFALAPLALAYGAVSGARMNRARRRSVPAPVLCIGNFTVGGAGKTPTALAIARAARGMGLNPGFLSRGYGGTLDVTTLVDPAHHRARDVGDEPLLLAREALTVICRKRLQGALRLIEAGADLIIMDDGFQSARLVIDYALVVVDGGRGIGNRFVVPAGPVRAPLAVQMRHASALLKVGDGEAADPEVRRAARAGKGVFRAAVSVLNGAEVAGRRVLAWAGIADPAKFHRSLAAVGAEIVDTVSFPDHHVLSDDEIADLLARAERDGLTLVTTAKDEVRLERSNPLAADLAARSLVLTIEMGFDDPLAPAKIITETLARAKTRRLAEGGVGWRG